MTAPPQVELPEPHPPRQRHLTTAPGSTPENLRSHHAGFARVFDRVRNGLRLDHRGVRARPRRRLVRGQRPHRNVHSLEQRGPVGGAGLLHLGIPLLRLLMDRGRKDARHADPRRAGRRPRRDPRGTRCGLLRTIAFPLSFLLLGLGSIGVLFGRDRRTLHDLIAGTAVVYASDAREARLRSLARHHDDPPA